MFTKLKKVLLIAAAVSLLFMVGCSPNEGPGQSNSGAENSQSAGDNTEVPGAGESNTPEGPVSVDGVGGTIMFLSSVSSGPTYDALVCFLEGMGDALGYDIKVVYGDMQNDPNGNLTAVKNGMTDDVKAIISMQDGGIQNIMDEYPELYVVGYTTAMDSVYSEGGASAAAASNDHFLGSVSGDYVDAARIGQMFAEKVIANGYHKVSTMIFPPFAYPDMVVKDAAFRAAIEEHNAVAEDADKIEVVGEAEVLMFAPLEDTYFMESDHADLDCVVAICDPGFVYSALISARNQGMIDSTTKLMAVGYLDDPNFQADIGGDGTVQMIYTAAPESLAYCVAMIDNALNGLSYSDYTGSQVVDSALYIIDSAEDIQNVVDKTMLGAPDFANSGVTAEQLQNVLLRYNANATYSDLIGLMASDSMTLDRFN